MSETTTIVIETPLGTIEAELDGAAAPKTVESVLRYVDEGFYDGTIFHRVIPGFMIQGGGMTAGMGEKANHAPVQNEADNGLKNGRGTLAMARTSVIDSASSQFFINLVDTPWLTGKHTVFGQVIKGMDVVDKIGNVPVGAGSKPTEPVRIISVEVVKPEK